MQTTSHSFATLLTIAGLVGACDSASPEPVAAEQTARPSGAEALAAEAGPAAQLPGFDLSIELSATDVLLQWQDTGAEQYEVWRSSYPYFQPGDFGAFSLGTVADTEYTDLGGNDDTNLNTYYYVVTEVGATGRSTTVGRHPLTLFNGFNKVPLPLETDVATTADVFDTASPSASAVYQFNSVSQQYEGYNPLAGQVPATLYPGTTPVAAMTLEGSVTRAIAGYVPAPGSLSITLQPGDNLVYLPLDFPSTTASELLAQIPGATDVGRWDPANQTGNWVNGPSGWGWPVLVVDSLIYPGADLHIYMGEGATTSWPIDRSAVSGSCCESNGNAYCDDAAVTECVCAADSYCCSNTWDSLCADEVDSLGCGTCEVAPPPEPGDCCTATPGAAGCLDAAIEACVCAGDDYCCNNTWDSLCVDEVQSFGCSDVCVAPE
ncbi:MAG: hypothetical protein AB1Z98_29415 [Nannocystaceae bacterium]